MTCLESLVLYLKKSGQAWWGGAFGVPFLAWEKFRSSKPRRSNSSWFGERGVLVQVFFSFSQIKRSFDCTFIDTEFTEFKEISVPLSFIDCLILGTGRLLET